MSWARGRAEVEQLITDGELERVRPSVEVAARLLADASAHVGLASKGIQEDPAGALQLCYDAARKAATALLASAAVSAGPAGSSLRWPSAMAQRMTMPPVDGMRAVRDLFRCAARQGLPSG